MGVGVSLARLVFVSRYVRAGVMLCSVIWRVR